MGILEIKMVDREGEVREGNRARGEGRQGLLCKCRIFVQV